MRQLRVPPSGFNADRDSFELVRTCGGANVVFDPMKHHDDRADILFSRVFSYAPRPGRSALEDFSTEGLAWCLRNSNRVRAEFFRLMQMPVPPTPVEVYTQEHFQ